MALSFKRSRGDTAHDRTYPNASATVIFRNDVTNKNLLKNPFRTGDISVGPVGVQNRPPNKMVDDRGAMYGGSVSVLRKNITNTNLLMNPYRFKTDPTDEPRTLTRQVINDINSGKTPKYVRENKGIDEIAFMIVKSLPDNGVKLATLSMLKSYITGMRLQSVLDQGGQNVVKAFDVLNQLVVTCTSLYKTGMLAIKLPGLLLQYSEDIAKVFNDAVLQPISPMLMFTAIQDLASVSSVLSKLFRAQNSVSASTNVSIDEWAKQEAAKLQALRQQEAANNAPPVPVQVQQVSASGDNQPTGTQGVRDTDTIKQEGTGKKRKKKKFSEMMGGAQLNWGIANPKSAQSLIESPNNSITTLPKSNISPPPNTVNAMPIKDPINVKIIDSGKSQIPYDTIIASIGTAISAAALFYTIRENSGAIQRENQLETDKENLRRAIASTYLTLTSQYKKVFDRFWGDDETTLSPGALSNAGFDNADISEILLESNTPRRLLKLLNKILEYQNSGKPLTAGWMGLDDSDREAGELERREEDRREAARVDEPREYKGDEPAEAADTPSPTPSQKVAALRAQWAKNPTQFEVGAVDRSSSEKSSGSGIKRKSTKSNKSKIKKSKNLDAQILALLKA